MKVSYVYIVLSVIGVQLLEHNVNAYVLLTANLDHLKAVQDRLQNSPIISKLQAAFEQLTNQKISIQERPQKRRPEKLKFRSYNRRSFLTPAVADRSFEEPNFGLLTRRRSNHKPDRTPSPKKEDRKKQAKKSKYTPRSYGDRDRVISSGEKLGSKDSGESQEVAKSIRSLKSALRKKPNVSSDYEDILKYVHIAEDHNKALRELRNGSSE